MRLRLNFICFALLCPERKQQSGHPRQLLSKLCGLVAVLQSCFSETVSVVFMQATRLGLSPFVSALCTVVTVTKRLPAKSNDSIAKQYAPEANY